MAIVIFTNACIMREVGTSQRDNPHETVATYGALDEPRPLIIITVV